MNSLKLGGVLWGLVAGVLPGFLFGSDAVGKQTPVPPSDPAFVTVEDVPGLPRVLLLGDSMSGIDFRLRQLIDPALAAVPTIVITATDVADNERASLRAEGWLEKPFHFQTLLQLVQRYVVAEG